LVKERMIFIEEVINGFIRFFMALVAGLSIDSHDPCGAMLRN
jgi:hypothetical protein